MLVEPALTDCNITERIYRVHLPRRERECIEFQNRKWINSRRNKPPCDPLQEYLETLSKYSILVQFEARSRERLAISPDTVTISRSPQHAACTLHWESGMHVNSRWALPEGSLDSESTTCRTKIELAIWSTRSTKPTRKIILGTIERFQKLRGNL